MKKWMFGLFLFQAPVARAADLAESSLFSVPGAYLFIVVAIAFFIALFAVIGMQQSLKTASRQVHAHQYIREDSFHLSVQEDRFLYENVRRRKIETKKKED